MTLHHILKNGNLNPSTGSKVGDHTGSMVISKAFFIPIFFFLLESKLKIVHTETDTLTKDKP